MSVEPSLSSRRCAAPLSLSEWPSVRDLRRRAKSGADRRCFLGPVCLLGQFGVVYFENGIFVGFLPIELRCHAASLSIQSHKRPRLGGHRKGVRALSLPLCDTIHSNVRYGISRIAEKGGKSRLSYILAMPAWASPNLGFSPRTDFLARAGSSI